MKKFNPYSLLDLSPWPFFSSLNFFGFGLGVVLMVRIYDVFPFLFSVFLFGFSSFLWGRDLHREGCLEGYHSLEVMDTFKSGMVFFILSECFFFGGMFWAYLHLSQSPSLEVGCFWPPCGIVPFDPKGVPFLNTVLLVSSGVSVTWCHHLLEKGEYGMCVFSLFVTVLLGVSFTFLQFLEYYVASFTFSCSAYSSVYYLGTGFHGLHVILGSSLLVLCLFRLWKGYISPFHNVSFECSVWYWHFVDVVWFFLYLVFYWWGV